MKYDDLAKTQDLFDIEDLPNPINNIEMEGASKDYVTEENDLIDTLENQVIKDNKKDKKKEKTTKKEDKEKKELSKKTKIIIIVSLCLVLLILIGVILFLVLKKDKKPDKPNEPEKPIVIIEKENYIYKDGILTFLNSNDEEIGTYTCTNKDENNCFVAYYNLEDNFDIEKNIYEDNTKVERRSTIYLDKYVFINDNKNTNDNIIKLYNIEEEKEEDTYTLVKGFSDSNYVILKDTNGKYGVLLFDKDNYKEILEFSYDYVGELNKDAKFVVKTSNKYYIFNKNGKNESKGLPYEIKSYNNNYITVYDDAYYVYDYKSNLIFDEPYDYISLLDKYAVLINDELLYIKDYQNNKYNEDGIDINSKDYLKTNIFNKDKTLIETKQGFSINIDDTNINVVYKNKNSEKTKSLNIYEGNISSKLKYVNYFDGKLYFYQDEDKNDLLGKYTCTTKNTIAKNTTTLNNCYIAHESFFSNNEVETNKSDSLGLIPIFNNNYVFINDSLDNKNITINLYDLKNDKTLSKYSAVDDGIYTKSEDVSFVDANDNGIIAKNKNNKYGLIKISNNVSGIIPFDYNYLEKLKEYYMATGSTNNYMLIDKSGEVITDKLGNKIVDYHKDYLKLIDSAGKYHVSDFTGNNVDNTAYLDLTLYDDYYVVIDINKKLNIANYNDFALELKDGIDIGDNYKNNYEVSKTTDGYIIKIKDTNETITVKTTEEESNIPDETPTIPEDDKEVDNNNPDNTENDTTAEN